MKPMRTYVVGKRTAKNYNEWMKYIHKQINKKKQNERKEKNEDVRCIKNISNAT